MPTNQIMDILNQNYNLNINKVELFREGGGPSYIVSDKYAKFLLKVIRQPFIHNALHTIDIHMYLQENQFPTMPIILRKNGLPYVRTRINDKERILILYEFIEGGEPDLGNTENVGELIANLHNIMERYRGRLTLRDKFFFIERYLNIMKNIKYDKVKEFESYGNGLWEKIKNLPRGYCHLDLNRGKVLQDSSGKLHVMDFDTSSTAFPMYDIALFCNDTDYFEFDYKGYDRSKAKLDQFLKGYLKYRSLEKDEIAAFFDLIAIYHFQLQTIMTEIHGHDSFNSDFLDKQLDWLTKWREQCNDNH